MRTDSDMNKIVEVRCSLKRRQRSQTASTARPAGDRGYVRGPDRRRNPG